MKYLIDTNILIYYFNGSLSISAKKIITAMFNDHFNISVISKMEFLGFSRFDADEKREAAKFVSYATVLPLSKAIVDRTIEQKTGARGLRAELEKVLMPHMFNLVRYHNNSIKKVIIDENLVNTPAALL